MKTEKLPKLPQLLERKIYKTGQTRGADDDVIYQNRVGRHSTVLIPYSSWKFPFNMPNGESEFENGFIVLISPDEYFGNKLSDEKLIAEGLEIGINALIFYETREQWDKYDPEKLQWEPAEKRIAPLGGNYVARVPATTATSGGGKIVRGFITTSSKGAGIRIYEYASKKTNRQCRDQLEALFWLCHDAEVIVAKNGMKDANIATRKTKILKSCSEQGLLEYNKLMQARTLNDKHNTVCPLCLEELSGDGFFSRMQQAEGREVPDLTVTEINLFHIEELRIGIYNHHPYNLGWGHHHCNVVTKDSGILPTLIWMKSILQRNIDSGYLDSSKSEG